MRIYCDVCCLGRPFDDQSQGRVHLETVAIEAIFARIASSELVWASGGAMISEIARTPDPVRRAGAQELLKSSQFWTPLSPEMMTRAMALERLGFPAFDALHLAYAEAAACDILITVDDRFVRRAQRLSPSSAVRVVNPAHWLSEIAGDHETA